MRIISSKLDDWTGIYEEDLDHLPQAKAAVEGLIKETQISLKVLCDLLDLERIPKNSPEILSEQLSCHGCIDLLREHLRILEKLLGDFG